MESATYQLEGVDGEGRYFSRSVILTDAEGVFSAHFNYEGLKIGTGFHPTHDEVLRELVFKLKEKGFDKIRARLNYIEGRYLVERRPWIYFPDQEVVGRDNSTKKP